MKKDKQSLAGAKVVRGGGGDVVSAAGNLRKFYVTTAIPYVNAAPHIGFAMEAVQADVLARWHRLKGDDTYFLTGVDEHGMKLFDTAKEAGRTPQEFADENAEKFKALKGVLGLSNDGFIRTTSDYHKKAAQKLWMKLVEAGDIYKGTYKGNYCVGCEAFILEKDLVDGKCPNHGKAPKIIEEENYFFKLSKYSDAIKNAIESDKLKVLPLSRKHEILNMIGEDGFKDVSFSRPKSVLTWGIDVPNDPTQVMYVWCDALSNYITALGYGSAKPEAGAKSSKAQSAGLTGSSGAAGNDLASLGLFERYWPCDAHIIGKDILRFHAGVWIGMLLSAGIALPKAIYVHGFVTSDGKKMSKSLGNVVDPAAYVNEFGNEPLRYYLIREIPTGDDGDFSRARFLEIYNGELANSFGNLVNRVVMMADRYLGGVVSGAGENKELEEKIKKIWVVYEKGMSEFNMKSSIEAALELIYFGNSYVDEQKPWALAKTDMNATAKVLYNLLEVLRNSALMLLPVIPEKAFEVLRMIGVGDEETQAAGAGSLAQWTPGGVLAQGPARAGLGYGKYFGFIKDGTKITKGEALFPRILPKD